MFHNMRLIMKFYNNEANRLINIFHNRLGQLFGRHSLAFFLEKTYYFSIQEEKSSIFFRLKENIVSDL